MRAVIVVEVDDEWVMRRVDALWKEHEPGEEPPKPTPHEYFVGRLQDVAQDELPIALWSWPATFSVEASE